ncbi:hypothetical protein Pcinc_033054 [Petrolisthes cinctipes]|uniref:Regulatory protein zeste n=1 Tax=Petrolisthes cinctipes TaxID=88211 RepID=A0AAE1ESV9_PETCI|nr:hypothetical protein Pcinc_033054 [Petrolisthes cinctipes]
MEEQGTERSSSPSGSEEVDSDGDSKHGDGVENGKDSDDENEENGKANESQSEDSDDSGEEEEEEEGSDNSAKSSENSKSEPGNKHNYAKDNDGMADESYGGYEMDGECYPLADLPLEVITTVEPTIVAYPVLKNMSNGVLTHRNIFTEFERSVLVNIINKYRNIVDTRSRTREIYLEKQSVWQQIVEEYNGTENIMVRTEKELRKCWDNMKYRAKQAEKVVKEEVKLEDDGVDIKMEPPEHNFNNFTSEYEGGGGGEESSWSGQVGEGALEEEREPALKRARQESPKLSSLLLAGPHKRSPSKKSGLGKSVTGTSHKSSNVVPGHYSLLEGNKTHHVKKKSQPMTMLNMAALSEIPILPKGLASCLSITNIPNPVSAASQGRSSVSPSSPPISTAMKPMPSLKKMVLGKQQSSGSKNSNLRNSKKSNGLSSKSRGHRSSYHNSLGADQSLTPRAISPTPVEVESERIDQAMEHSLNARLATQRLELERKEHELRMKLLEKELQTHTHQSQYWSLKLKLLRAGRETVTLGISPATNGDID